jgi:hypothetical protein
MIIFNGKEYKSRNNLSYENYYINIESDLDYAEFLEKLMEY